MNLQQYPLMISRSWTTSWLQLAWTYKVQIHAFDLAHELWWALAKDKGMPVLPILGKKCDPFLCLGDVLLLQEYFSWVDCGCHQGWLWVLWDCNPRQTQVSDCFCDLWSSLILLWDVVANKSTVFWYLVTYFVSPMSKVWFSSPSTLVRNYFLAGTAFLAGLLEWHFPSILGLVSVMFSCLLGVEFSRPAQLVRF